MIFVDDEPRILGALERMMHTIDAPWQPIFVADAASALELVEQDEVAVVVSDMKMPGVDGAELMRALHQRRPETVRIILSGFTEDEVVLRALPDTHQFLPKPCRPTDLVAAVSGVLQLRDVLASDTLRRKVGEIDRLPPAPRLYLALSQALSNERVSADAVSELIAQDPGTSAKVLQLVSSALFARGSPVRDVKTAVIRLGMRVVRTLTLAVEVFSTSTMVSASEVERLQRLGLQTSVLAHRIAPPGVDADLAALAGLLADVGRLILTPEDATTSHAEVGAYLLGLWALPPAVVEAVAFHHRPSTHPRATFGVVGAVHVAQALIEGLELDRQYLERAGVGGRVEEWERMARGMRGVS